MEISWSRCLICQTTTTEDLRCPLRACGPCYDPVSVYASFLQNVLEFSSLGALPVNVPFALDIDTDVLIKNEASWHKSCYLKFNLSKLQKAKERVFRKREKEEGQPEEEEKARAIKNRRKSLTNNKEDCILCGKGGQLHEVTTFSTDQNICRMITEINDATLMPKISGVDLIAAEAKYHLKCLTDLRNRYRSQLTKKRQESCGKEDEKIMESQAFIELVEYIENSVQANKLLFKLSELHSLYISRLESLGVYKTVNKTRLKNSLLDQFPDAQEQTDGKNLVIIFTKALQGMVKDAIKKRDFSEDATILAKASAIVRRDILKNKGFNFSGNFTAGCQEMSTPASLKSLIYMILSGLDIENTEAQDSQPCLTVCQTIIFNGKERRGRSKTGQTRHTKSREPPLPLYIGLTIHATTRSKALIMKLYELGLSVSYQRIMEIEESLASSVSEQFVADGCVVPASLRKGLLTIGALDNLDHNPSSTTAASSFHGTGISLFQLPTAGNHGELRDPIRLPSQGSGHSLPEKYAVVHPVELSTNSSVIPARITKETGCSLIFEKGEEKRWMEETLVKFDKENVMADDMLMWAAFHSAKQVEKDPPALTALLPIFYEKAATPAMIKHGMDVIRQATTFLNPGQVPVITVDQPLFALVKMVQWKWPTSHGEQAFVAMMGGLHVEMALWSAVGDLLDGSRWTTALTEADVASSGVADSFLKASHLTRTRYV